ncbi:hypothetical protein EC973_001078 [Apophysomyces ossiformis]|uniref:D-lactate dehydratase n=1 Tax=Apophysomyces ossiformis TaxID=679940 RepID=A0A8H7BMK7_9FUNG|nr:hypothetical protein EC973_001078 [Apophysomyces ossiformis]
MTKKAIVLIADGTEDMEFTCTVDIIGRAGIEVISVGVELANKTYAVCRQGIKIIPDAIFENQSWVADDFDALVVPGGLAGAQTLANNTNVQTLVQSFYAQKKIVAFICAGPLVAKSSGIPNTHTLTSHPSVRDQLASVYTYSEDRVVVDQNVITSRGPGTAFLFGLTIAEQLLGDKKLIETMKEQMVTTSVL